MNPALAKIEIQTASLTGAGSGATPETRVQHLKRIADSYDALAAQVEALEPTDGKLKSIATDMAKLYVRTAKNARAMAKNVASDRVKPLASASRRLERQVREQKTLVKRAKRVCKMK